MRILVTGAAGFIGSHLSRRLLADGNEVIGMDNLVTGTLDNIEDLFLADAFTFVRHDVTNFIYVPGDLDAIFHLASPASPVDYLKLPIQTLKVNGLGTYMALGVAKHKKASFLLASTSEVYGDPQVHPQPESYWGHVNPVGPRGVYDESKRYAEALTMAYHQVHDIDTHIVRIFNTYGPNMRIEDGRAIPNFITQALQGRPITIYGDGSQTRSFCYVSDLVDGLVRLMGSTEHLPTNIGNPTEKTISELAEAILAATGSDAGIVYEPRPVDDPEVRRPDITKAKECLGWEPTVPFEEGIVKTIDWYRGRLLT
jgi:dTDP-glucose 4,6-dehydratase